ncbi:unnamed protein product [Effrenium voratum]|uniref:Peroxisomal ATPase PEX1 n=1 Tax=Effrenium voratum TaxID=2562239 RepID=A0AA36HPI3_9DINO|nr:unnamed protein product [Effrenium voratum]
MVQPNRIEDWEVVELQAGFIEENLLSQVSVLMPGMIFPVWVHGQLVAKLQLDPADPNTSECFMLGRDTELAIESRQREREGVSMSADEEEEIFHLRVFGFDEDASMPLGLLRKEDLDSIAGGLSSCLMWLDAPCLERPTDQPETQLLRLTVDTKALVPPGHVILGASFAEWLGLPRFGLAKLRRCHQVPVFVPRVELVPCGPGWEGVSPSFREDTCWLRRRFESLVKAQGEVHLADGAPLLLRPEKDAEDVVKDSLAPTMASTCTVGSGSEADLYEGLSDIDDIYQQLLQVSLIWGRLSQQPRRQELPICADAECGVYEVDLGLDLVEMLPNSSSCRPEQMETPQAILVYIRLAVGAARDLRNGREPPFARISGGEPMVTIADLESGTSAPSRPKMDPLGRLWSGLPRDPPEDWTGVVELVPPFCSGPIDAMSMVSESAETLHRYLQACLGASGKGGMFAKTADPRLGVAVPGMVAVTGSPGSGKTRLCRRILSQMMADGVLPLQVMCGKLGPAKKFTTVQEWLRAVVFFACWYSPCVVLLDDFGALCPDVEPGAPNLSITEERSSLLAEMLLDLLPEVRSSGARVAFVVTIPDDSSVHRMLWTWPALEHKVAIRQPQLKERPEILMALVQLKVEEGWDVEQALLAEGALDAWGGRVDGFSIADLCDLVERACVEANVQASGERLRDGTSEWGKQRLCMEQLQKACEDFVPATMADQTFFTSEVQLADIGGLQSAKQELMDMLTMPTRYAVLLDRAPVRTRKGLMLVGPPGCGKTMLIQAAAHETKGLLRFLSVKGPELLSKYIGESEAGVRKVFERAAAAAPAVIFFDEIEALTPKRGADSTGVTDRVVNQMLCYLDGVEDRGRVFVVAATGRPDMVDPALMRPGRFDKICYCGLPSEAEKLDICQVLARKNKLTDGAPASAEADLNVQLRQLVSRLPRLFTSADINALFSSAKIEAVNEKLKKEAVGEPKITMGHLYTALESAKASVSESDERRHAQIFAPYCGGSGSRGGLGETAKAVKVALA